ncbi:MAG TPA: hypothetical protein VKP30_02340, partial [Polyangiaceae bacterium]|nr:hypothetical protein [Polyangiaceae bacterium]
VYLRSGTAESCPNQAQLKKAVARRLGYDPFLLAASHTIVLSTRGEGKSVGGGPSVNCPRYQSSPSSILDDLVCAGVVTRSCGASRGAARDDCRASRGVTRSAIAVRHAASRGRPLPYVTRRHRDGQTKSSGPQKPCGI